MTLLKNTFRASYFSLFFCLLILSAPGHAQFASATNIDPQQVVWNHLSFKSKNIFGTVKTVVQLKTVSIKEIERLLIRAPGGDAIPAEGAQIFTIMAHSVIDPLFGSNDELKTQAWYNPKAGAALQRVRWRRGKEIWQKTYRFTSRGVFRLRKRPNDSEEAKLPLEQWTNIEESFYAYNVSNAGCSHVLEPLALLYLVSSADLAIGDTPLRLCLFSKKQLHRVQIRRDGIKRLKINYTERSKKGIAQKKGEIETVKFSFKTRSLAGDDIKAEPFSFLGLKGDFDIFIDKVSRIPVRVSGKLPTLGRVNFKLDEVQMSPK